jgi:hypothetical protein
VEVVQVRVDLIYEAVVAAVVEFYQEAPRFRLVLVIPLPSAQVV